MHCPHCDDFNWRHPTLVGAVAKVAGEHLEAEIARRFGIIVEARGEDVGNIIGAVGGPDAAAPGAKDHWHACGSRE